MNVVILNFYSFQITLSTFSSQYSGLPLCPVVATKIFIPFTLRCKKLLFMWRNTFVTLWRPSLKSQNSQPCIDFTMEALSEQYPLTYLALLIRQIPLHKRSWLASSYQVFASLTYLVFSKQLNLHQMRSGAGLQMKKKLPTIICLSRSYRIFFLNACRCDLIS